MGFLACKAIYIIALRGLQKEALILRSRGLIRGPRGATPRGIQDP
jgi:hypothetical protein